MTCCAEQSISESEISAISSYHIFLLIYGYLRHCVCGRDDVRRVKSDLIMCYKILNNLVDIDVHSFFTLSDYVSTRNNGVKLNKTR